jgi:hypothetical protein
MSSAPIPPSTPVFQPALFTPAPKGDKRVLEFFSVQIDNDHTRKAHLNAPPQPCRMIRNSPARVRDNNWIPLISLRP